MVVENSSSRPGFARMKKFHGWTLALVASAILFYFGSGLHPLWWLTWLAPLPVLMVVPHTGAWKSFALGLFAWFIGSMNIGLFYLRTGIPIFILVPFLLIPAGAFGLVTLLFGKFVLRSQLWRAAFGFPLAWVTCEYLISLISPHSTFGNLGYSQIDFLPLLQVVSLTGIWGISFCLLLLPATVAALMNRPSKSTKWKRLAIVTGLVIAMSIVYGSWRLSSNSLAGNSVRIALMSGRSRFPQDDATALKLLRYYSDQIEKVAPDHDAEIIVLPEKLAVISDQATAEADALFESTAAHIHSYILLGLDRGTQRKRFNEARLYSPDGKVASTYVKQHLIPGVESVDQPGTNLAIIDEPSGAWGIEICKDLDFPGLSRQYGTKHVGLLLVPAWDFGEDGWLHDRMAVMRGVENGFTIARAAKDGLLTISDDRGRILATQSTTGVEFAFLFGTARVRHDDTLYTRWGDWFAYASIVALLAIIFIPEKQNRAAS